MAKHELSVWYRVGFISEMPTVKYSVFSFECGSCLLECKRLRFLMTFEVSGKNFGGDSFPQMPETI